MFYIYKFNNDLTGYFEKVFLIAASIILLNPAVSQCVQYNVSVSSSNQIIYRTPEIKSNSQFSYRGIWYKDSIAVNEKKYTRVESSDYKCLLIKLDNEGKIVAQTDIILPAPIMSNPTLRYNPQTGGLVYVLSIYNIVYKINNTLSVDARNKSVLGVVHVDSALNNIEFVQIAESKPNERLWEGENDLYCDRLATKMLVLVNKTMFLNNGDSIKPVGKMGVYSLRLDTKFRVSDNKLLASDASDISTYGMINTPVGFYYCLKFYNSISVPNTSKTYISALRKTIPSIQMDGNDILIIKELNGDVVSSYSIGCPSTITANGIDQKLFYANHRFYFPLNNAGQNLYDDSMKLMSVGAPRKNALAVFDTSFLFRNLLAFEDESKPTRVRIGLFLTSENKLILTGNSDSSFRFNGITYKPDIEKKPVYMNVVFELEGDSVKYKWQRNSNNYISLYTNFDSKSASFNMFPFPNKQIDTAYNMILNKPVYNNYSWMLKVCLPTTGNQPYESANIKMYPNPVLLGKLFINADLPIERVTILTVQGQQVMQQRIQGNCAELNVENIAAGNYVVKVEGSTFLKVAKILVDN